MAANIAGLMSKSKYSHNIYRTGDIMTNAPFTVLNSESGIVVQLPLPQNISSSLTADWQQQQVSVAEMAIRHGAIGATSSTMDQIASNPSLALDMMKSGTGILGGEATALLSRSKSGNSQMHGPKITLNPRNEMLFNGMGFRTFSFVFTLVPFKKADSDNIQKAIRAIQKASVPDLRGVKMFMEYPETWTIKFMESNEYLMKINECCCTRVDVNYSPNGSANQMHKNNAPIAVELTLDFTEVIIPTKENIDRYNG